MDPGRIHNFIAQCRSFSSAINNHWLRNYENFSSDDVSLLFGLEDSIREMARRVERASGVLQKGTKEKWKGND